MQSAAALADFREAVEQFSDVRWRLNNLYWITDKEGRRIKFEMNWAQEALFNEMHYLNLILKARQLGFTTFVQLFMLDACLFNQDIRAGTIAHTRDDAEIIFRDKVKYPYDNLPDQLKAAVSVKKDTASELLFANNSSIRVGTSHRSGTLNYLHVSEYGKVCAHFPDKAREIKTGALNTVEAGQIAWIESTAEGQEGDFYDLCQSSQAKRRTGETLTSLDFKFHFYPWWKHGSYRLPPETVTVPASIADYAAKLEAAHGIALGPDQLAWYAKKAEQQGDDIKREFPSTPEEAFEAAIEGAYYAHEMAAAELQGRIGVVPVDPGMPVHTVLDIGVGDDTAIWLWQALHGGLHIVGCYHGAGEGVGHYVKWLEDWRRRHPGVRFGTHWAPPDAKVREWGAEGRTRIQSATLLYGLRFRVVPEAYVDDGIQAARLTIPRCRFDAAACADGLKALKAYRKDWDERLGRWKSTPRHDWSSHYADAFRYLALAWREPAPDPPPKPRMTTMADVTLDRLWEDESKKRGRRI